MKKIKFRQTIAMGLLMAFSVSSVTPSGSALSALHADTLRALNVSEGDKSGLEESLKLSAEQPSYALGPETINSAHPEYLLRFDPKSRRAILFATGQAPVSDQQREAANRLDADKQLPQNIANGLMAVSLNDSSRDSLERQIMSLYVDDVGERSALDAFLKTFGYFEDLSKEKVKRPFRERAEKIRNLLPDIVLQDFTPEAKKDATYGVDGKLSAESLKKAIAYELRKLGYVPAEGTIADDLAAALVSGEFVKHFSTAPAALSLRQRHALLFADPVEAKRFLSGFDSFSDLQGEAMAKAVARFRRMLKDVSLKPKTIHDFTREGNSNGELLKANLEKEALALTQKIFVGKEFPEPPKFQELDLKINPKHSDLRKIDSQLRKMDPKGIGPAAIERAKELAGQGYKTLLVVLGEEDPAQRAELEQVKHLKVIAASPRAEAENLSGLPVIQRFQLGEGTVSVDAAAAMIGNDAVRKRAEQVLGKRIAVPVISKTFAPAVIPETAAPNVLPETMALVIPRSHLLGILQDPEQKQSQDDILTGFPIESGMTSANDLTVRSEPDQPPVLTPSDRPIRTLSPVAPQQPSKRSWKRAGRWAVLIALFLGAVYFFSDRGEQIPQEAPAAVTIKEEPDSYPPVLFARDEDETVIPPAEDVVKVDAPLRQIEGDILGRLAGAYRWSAEVLDHTVVRASELRRMGAGSDRDKAIALYNRLQTDVYAAQAKVIEVQRRYVTGDEQTRDDLWEDYQAAVQGWFDARHRQAQGYVELADYIRGQQNSLFQRKVNTVRDVERAGAASEIADVLVSEGTAFEHLNNNLVRMGETLPFFNATLPGQGVGYTPQTVPVIPNPQRPETVPDRDQILVRVFDQVQEILNGNRQKLGVDIRLRNSEYDRMLSNYGPRRAAGTSGISEEEMDKGRFLKVQTVLKRAQQERLSAQSNFTQVLEILTQTRNSDALPWKDPRVREAVGDWAARLAYSPDAVSGQNFEPTIIVSALGSVDPLRDFVFLAAQDQLSKAISNEMDALVVVSEGLVEHLQNQLGLAEASNRRIKGLVPRWEILLKSHVLDQAKQQLEVARLVRANDVFREQLGFARGEVESSLPGPARRVLETDRGFLLPGASVTQSTDDFDDLIEGADDSVQVPLAAAERFARTWMGRLEPLPKDKADERVRQIANNERAMISARIRMLENQNQLAVELAGIVQGLYDRTPSAERVGLKQQMEDAQYWRDQSELRDAQMALLQVDIRRRDPDISNEDHAALSRDYDALVFRVQDVAARINQNRTAVLARRVDVEKNLELQAEIRRRMDQAEVRRIPKTRNQILLELGEQSGAAGGAQGSLAVRSTEPIERALQSFGQTEDQGALLKLGRQRNEELQRLGAPLDSPDAAPSSALPTLEDIVLGGRPRIRPPLLDASYTIALGANDVQRPLVAGAYTISASGVPVGPSTGIGKYVSSRNFITPEGWHVPQEQLSPLFVTDSNASALFRLGEMSVYRQVPSVSGDGESGQRTVLISGLAPLSPRPTLFAGGVLVEDPNDLDESPDSILRRPSEGRKMIVLFSVQQVDKDGNNAVAAVYPAEVLWKAAGELSINMFKEFDPQDFQDMARKYGPLIQPIQGNYLGIASQSGSYLLNPKTGKPIVTVKPDGFYRYKIQIRYIQGKDGRMEPDIGLESEFYQQDSSRRSRRAPGQTIRSAPPAAQKSGLEEGLSRRDLFKSGVVAGLLYWASLSLTEIAAQALKAPPAPRGALVPLAKQLGPDRDLSIIIWNAGEAQILADRPALRTVKLQDLFNRAVAAGVTKVYISGFDFNKSSPNVQKALLNQANASGLKTLGFIDGNYDWAAQSQFVAGHYDKLTRTLEGFYRDGTLGKLQIAFATDIEPWTGPNGKRWNGDFSGVADLTEKVILPAVQAFSRNTKDRVKGPLVTQFVPFWAINNHKMDDGRIVTGVREIRNTRLAGMTYRNRAEGRDGILDVAGGLLDRVERANLGGTNNVRLSLGAEMASPAVAGGPRLTFNGDEARAGSELSRVWGNLSPAQRRNVDEIFFHFEHPKQADSALQEMLKQDASASEKPSAPGTAAKEFGVQGGKAAISRDGLRMDLKLQLTADMAKKKWVAVPMIFTDTWYVQPTEDAKAGYPVSSDGSATVQTVARSPFVGKQTQWSAVVLLEDSDFKELVGKGAVNAKGVLSKSAQIIKVDSDGTVTISKGSKKAGLEEGLLRIKDGMALLPKAAVDVWDFTEQANPRVEIYAHASVAEGIPYWMPSSWGLARPTQILSEDPNRANGQLDEAARSVEEGKTVVVGLDVRQKDNLNLPRAVTLLLNPDTIQGINPRAMAAFLSQAPSLKNLILDLTSGTIRTVTLGGEEYYALDISA